MRPHLSSTIALLSAALTFSPFASAIKLIESKSLNPCQDNSNFTASLFNVVFTPNNRTITFDVVGVSSIQGNVTAQLEVIAYGFTAVNMTFNPCNMGLQGLCPMTTGQINIASNLPVGEDVMKKIPGLAYRVPDLDGVVRIYIRLRDSTVNVACVEANLSNGKSVDNKAVGWSTAVIAGLGLIASAVTSGLGHSNTAAHVAANALSLFGFFQAQAIIGMTAVRMPPIVQSWTQNFQWSMGIIRIGFLQSICTWYQRSTGGSPTTYLSTLATTSVQVQKRTLQVIKTIGRKSTEAMVRRASSPSSSGNTKVVVVRGIDRVGFRAGIEQTNIFLTGLIFFLVFCSFVAIFVALFKGFCEVAIKANWMKSDKFVEFRHGWKIVLKGILYRLVLIGYPQMSVLCLWELVERDSVAEVILALVIFISMTVALCWASLKVIRLAQRSVMMHKNPAYMLYSDPTCLNKWGFLYVQYRATAYYFVLPMLVYILIKSIFIAFCQASPVAQAIGLLIIEAVALIGFSVLRPWMDRKTNIFNISIAVINFVNVIFLLVFTGVFDQPGLVTGIMGVLFALYNVVFAAILLILVFVASVYAICSKNPDTRYQPMRDDRGSFIKSQSALTTELDALGVTARGDMKEHLGNGRNFADDQGSSSSDSLNHQKRDMNAGAASLPPSKVRSNHYDRPGSPETHAMFPATYETGRRGPPMYDNANIIDSYHQDYHDGDYQSGYEDRVAAPNPQPRYGHANGGFQRNDPRVREQQSRSPWQRGAGYE